MDRRQLLLGTTALGLSAQLRLLGLVEQMQTNDSRHKNGDMHISDRERAQLRGLVRTVVESELRTEYDLQGNLLSWSIKDLDGHEYGDAYNFDDYGRVRSIVSRKWDGKTVEKAYSYDDKGRLLAITNSDGERSTFEYDNQGHKTETRVLVKTDRPPAMATGIDVVFGDIDASLAPGIRFPNAGAFKTLYNDQDQPTETQALDADGHLLGRVVRTYDEKGRIFRVREIVDDPMSQFPPKAFDEAIAQSGLPTDEVRAQLAKAFSAFQSGSGRTYSYDSDGHIEKISLASGTLGTFARTYRYNNLGDVIEEHTELARNPAVPVGVPFQVDDNGKAIPDKPPSEWPPQHHFGLPSDTRYSYQCDSHGNWTERTITRTYSFSGGSSLTTRRELSYY